MQPRTAACRVSRRASTIWALMRARQMASSHRKLELASACFRLPMAWRLRQSRTGRRCRSSRTSTAYDQQLPSPPRSCLPPSFLVELRKADLALTRRNVVQASDAVGAGGARMLLIVRRDDQVIDAGNSVSVVVYQLD